MHETKIEMKIHEEIKPLEEVCKKLTEEFAANIDKAKDSDLPAAGAIVDMIKDLCEAKEKVVKACYYKYILGCMEKNEEEDKEEEKYFLRMLKEEYRDEYKKMKEEYGEGEETDRRFYDSWRRSNGEFARKGTGEYRPRSYYRRGNRRGYEEMPYMHIPEDMTNPEWYRDMDRDSRNRLYYTPMTGNMGNSSTGTNSGGNTRNYEDGYSEGNRRGYEEGYREGERIGRNKGGSASRYDRARHGYTETKMSDDGTPESKKKSMESLDHYMRELADDMTELVGNMDNSEKTMLKSKLQGLMQKIQ